MDHSGGPPTDPSFFPSQFSDPVTGTVLSCHHRSPGPGRRPEESLSIIVGHSFRGSQISTPRLKTSRQEVECIVPACRVTVGRPYVCDSSS